MSFQFTASYEANQWMEFPYLKPGFFQFTASYEADLFFPWMHSFCIFLSIHSLIRGWPCRRIFGINRSVFQFTASYEADQPLTQFLIWWTVFQFTASYEADPGISVYPAYLTTFQFTASYEADRVYLPAFLNMFSFNSQPHMRLTYTSVPS